MSTRTPDDDIPVRRIDRVLAFTSLGLALAAIISFFAIMIATATGMEQADFTTGVWPLVTLIPLFGLPVAFILIVMLLIMSFIRRSRANRGG